LPGQLLLDGSDQSGRMPAHRRLGRPAMTETRVLHRVSQKAFPRNRGIVSLLKMTSDERGNR
jgi:hypothetical protein